MRAGWITVRLDEVVELNPPLPGSIAPTETVSFVPMAAASAVTATVDAAEERTFKEVAKGFTPFLAGDLLVAKITPCFENGKIVQATIPYQVGFGSTEFHVVRPRKDKVDLRYLLHFLRQDHIRRRGERRMTGSAGQRRVPEDFLASFPIPLPPLPEQRRIAAILDEADALRAKRRAALEQLNSLTQSIFFEMFGDARHEKTRWPVVPFDALVRETRLGLVRAASECGPDLPIPYVRMNALTADGQLEIEGVTRTQATDDEMRDYTLEPGDFLFNTRNSRELVGKTALFRGGGQFVFNNNLMRIRLAQDVEPEYVAAAFQTQFIQQELETRKSGTTSVFAVYYKDLKTLPMPVPPKTLQMDFAKRVAAVRNATSLNRSSQSHLDALSASLHHRAFSGAL